MVKQLRAISEHRRMLENMIIKLADMNKDSGDLTDQLTTMFNLNTKFSAVLRRAMEIVPVYEDGDLEEDDMNEAIPYMYKLQQDGKSVEEIAKELNMTVDAVKAAMSKQHADEGYSKHPKGSKKYKQHMAAMHAAKG